jgi:hypothetical protein
MSGSPQSFKGDVKHARDVRQYHASGLSQSALAATPEALTLWSWFPLTRHGVQFARPARLVVQTGHAAGNTGHGPTRPAGRKQRYTETGPKPGVAVACPRECKTLT